MNEPGGAFSNPNPAYQNNFQYVLIATCCIGILMQSVMSFNIFSRSQRQIGKKTKQIIGINISSALVSLVGVITLNIGNKNNIDYDTYEHVYQVVSIIYSVNYFLHYIDKIYLL